MEYRYITENNLEEKQNYMYSEYGGNEFLGAYIESRQKNIREKTSRAGGGDTRDKLTDLLLHLPDLNKSAAIKNTLGKLVQSFEVRKRIYTRTDEVWKPMAKEGEDNSYEDMDNYILFGMILVQAYYMTDNLKYFNCLLKLDDTLISVRERLTGFQRSQLSRVLGHEMMIYRKLSGEGEEA